MTCLCKKCQWGQRHVMVLLCFIVLCECYVSRYTSILCANIVIRQISDKVPNSQDICFEPKKQAAESSEAVWDVLIESQNLVDDIVKFYFFGTVTSALVGGYIGDKQEPKMIILVSLLASAAAGALDPFLLRVTGTLTTVKVVRFVHGFTHGWRIPVVTSILSRWLPKNERTLYVPMAYCSIGISSIINTVFTRYLINLMDWREFAFYVYAVASLVIALIWWLFASSDPFCCPKIKEEEMLYLTTRLKQTVNKLRAPIPILRILLSVPVWVFIIAYAGNIWLWDFLSLFLMTYMRDIFDLDMKQSSHWCTLSFGTMTTLTVIIAILGQKSINNNYLSQGTVRRNCSNVGSMGPPIFLLAASFAKCRMHLAFSCLIIAMTLCGMNFCGLRLIPMDLSPNYAGFITGLGHSIACFGSSFSSNVMNNIVPNDALLEYRKAFWIIMAICTGSILPFVFFGDTEIQMWNMAARKTSIEQKKENHIEENPRTAV